MESIRGFGCVICAFLSFLSAPIAAAKAPSSGSESGAAAYVEVGKVTRLETIVWERILTSPTQSAKQRATSLVQIYKFFANGRLRKDDEAIVFLAMAVLHSYERDLRYVALPFLKSALSRRPTLIEHKNISTVWKIFVQNFASRSPRDEVTLAGIAALLDGPMLQNAAESRFAYFRGIRQLAQGSHAESLGMFSKVSIDSFDYRFAKFAEGASLAANGKLADALAAFQVVVSLEKTDAESAALVSGSELVMLKERAVLQTARILYEMGSFEESLAYYRTLRQDSSFFFESLSEQAWAFFMAGYPNRAKGAVYAAETPFFAAFFNPDVYFLDAVLAYWMCDFSGANEKLKRFFAHSKNEGDALRGLVLRFGNDSEAEQLTKYARIAEDVFKGVSPKNIGLGPKVLSSLVRVVDVSDHLKDLEKLRSERLGFKEDKRYPTGKDRLDYALVEFEKTFFSSIGAQVRNRLKTMANVMDETLKRTRLLHLEVLTATKDAVVGKARTVQGNEFDAKETEFSDVGQDISRSWIQDKNEFWYDELGHYVFRENSKCKLGTP
jgi:tetratricopeptide (TPR) repeat protein